MIKDSTSIKSKAIVTHKNTGAWITLIFDSVWKEQNILNDIKSELITNYNNIERIKSFERVKEITYFCIFIWFQLLLYYIDWKKGLSAL